ncbi:hypothetical protein [Microbacterium soli]|uniref:Uncharacterized protein n=1 Tax=Microbacterium soli TaxID=446075 RepID=A0ABP7N310_9MICO
MRFEVIGNRSRLMWLLVGLGVLIWVALSVLFGGAPAHAQDGPAAPAQAQQPPAAAQPAGSADTGTKHAPQKQNIPGQQKAPSSSRAQATKAPTTPTTPTASTAAVQDVPVGSQHTVPPHAVGPNTRPAHAVGPNTRPAHAVGPNTRPPQAADAARKHRSTNQHVAPATLLTPTARVAAHAFGTSPTAAHATTAAITPAPPAESVLPAPPAQHPAGSHSAYGQHPPAAPSSASSGAHAPVAVGALPDAVGHDVPLSSGPSAPRGGQDLLPDSPVGSADVSPD